MSNIQIVLLVGLPGSGKTNFCKNMISNSLSKVPSSNLNFFHVCFDKIVPVTDQQELVNTAKAADRNDSTSADSKSVAGDAKEDPSSPFGRFKDARASVLENVEKLVGFLTKNASDRDFILSLASSLKFEASLESSLDDKHRFILLIDDNFYYRSMRREYYALAAKYRTCFSLVFMDTSIARAIELDKARAVPEVVGEEVVTTMSERLERPDPSLHRWERNCLTLHSSSGYKSSESECYKEKSCPVISSSLDENRSCKPEDTTSCARARTSQNIWFLVDGDNTDCIHYAHRLFACSFDAPVLDLDLSEAREHEASASRLVTSSSFSHAADLVLRELVRSYVVSGSLPALSKILSIPKSGCAVDESIGVKICNSMSQDANNTPVPSSIALEHPNCVQACDGTPVSKVDAADKSSAHEETVLRNLKSLKISSKPDKKSIARVANLARQRLLRQIKGGLLELPNEMTSEETSVFMSIQFINEIVSLQA